MKSILDPSFKYTSSAETDVRKTFARICRELRTSGKAAPDTVADRGVANNGRCDASLDVPLVQWSVIRESGPGIELATFVRACEDKPVVGLIV